MPMGTNEEILNYFYKLIEDDPNMSASVAAIKTLLKCIEENKVGTLSEMRAFLKEAINKLKQTDLSTTSIESGCELFLRFITLANLQQQSDFQECQKILVHRGNLFLNKVAMSRKRIAKLANPFITDGATILTHSKSRVVLQVLKEAAESKKRFKIFITQSLPDGSGSEAAKELSALGIPTTVILDAAVGYVMEMVDFVVLGAEGVVESGGIINKIGTYTIAMSAKIMSKPVYVVAESFKFHRFFPLNQQDLPNDYKYQTSTLQKSTDLSQEHPLVDYTPPVYITLLFSDLGILTPSAVSDELIKLYC